MYALIMPSGLYVRKGGGMNDFVPDPRDATSFRTREDAQAGKPGHHRDMGGSGFKGRVINHERAVDDYTNYLISIGKPWW